MILLKLILETFFSEFNFYEKVEGEIINFNEEQKMKIKEYFEKLIQEIKKKEIYSLKMLIIILKNKIIKLKKIKLTSKIII